MSLQEVLEVPEVARRAKWHRRRMLRFLQKMNDELGGLLLVNVGTKKKPRWTVTLKAMEAIAPGWFVDTKALEARLEQLEGRVVAVERNQGIHRDALQRLARTG